MRTMRSARRLVAFLTVGATIAVATMGVVAPAHADPIDDKVAQARSIQERIAANAEATSALGEQYNRAQYELEQAQLASSEAQRRLAAATREVDRVKGLLDERAADVYRHSLKGKSLDGFDLSDSDNLMSRRKYADAQADRENGLLARLVGQQREVAEQSAAAEAARAQIEIQTRQIEASRALLAAADAEQQQLLAQTQGELGYIVLAEVARHASADLADAQAQYADWAQGDGGPEQFPNLLPPGPEAAAAIAFALRQLGKPYLYAAAGPDTFDCSGLVMAAYQAAGISLIHYSGAQYASLPHVPLRSMLPGDLVFWGPEGSKHVAIYVGAGRILEAGGSAHNVHIGPIWGRPIGAARPA